MHFTPTIAVFCAFFTGTAVGADENRAVLESASRVFDRMPQLRIEPSIVGHCDADENVNADVIYCTTANVIVMSAAAQRSDRGPYQIAHLLGHAIQVRHGIADFALGQIRARRDEEVYLRGLVARQVECLAGMLYARAGLPAAQITDWFDEEPFAGRHWGRDPLTIGPQVSIGMDARNEWFVYGQTVTTPASCAVGELPAGPLVDAFKG
jgi:hypothetical protein